MDDVGEREAASARHQLTRRRMLGGTIAAGAVAGLAYRLAPPLFRPRADGGITLTASTDTLATLYTSCHQCDQQCAAIASVRDGVLVKLDGNPADYKSAGRLCPKGQAGILEVYNPYRLKQPLLRTNPEKGFEVDPGWKEVSWDEAISFAGGKLKDIISTDGAKAIAGDDWKIVGDFFQAIGSPNTYRCGNTCYYNTTAVQTAVLGTTFMAADLQEGLTKYVVMFSNTVGTIENPFGRQVAAAKAGGAKIVAFDPRLSESAAKADVWAPIRPGTDLAALLAMIHVLVTEDLYDRSFVESYTHGFDRLASFVKPYTPEWAAGITGVPATTLHDVAAEFGTRRPSVAIIRRGPSKQRKDYWRVVHAWVILNALVGAVDTRGTNIADRVAELGKVTPPKTPPAPYPMSIDERQHLLPTPGTVWDSGLLKAGTQDAFANSILDGPYPIKALICAGANWIHSSPNTAKWAEVLKDRFLMVIDYQMTDTAWFADVVLPCPTYLERNQVVAAANYAPFPQVQVRQEVVKPLYDTMSEGKIFALLGQRLGVADYLPPTGKAVLDAKLKPLGVTFAQLQEKGLVTVSQPFTPIRKFNTPTGKIELYSTIFEKAGFDALPAWAGPSVEPTGSYPLYFVSFNVGRGYMSEHAWNAWLTEPGDTGLWVNTATAAKQGIRDGDQIYVESPWGGMKAVAKLTEGIRPDTVAMLHGRGYRNPMTAPCARVGANESDIARPATAAEHLAWYRDKEEPFGNARYRDFTVKIYKV